MKSFILILGFCLSIDCWAAVFKCTDPSGHTFYQSSPCTEEHQSVQINTKTGGTVDLSAQNQEKAMSVEQRKQFDAQQLAEEQAKAQAHAELKKQLLAETELTQALIKHNSLQFSAFAIPVYDLDKLPDTVKPFEARLPEIEKFRRFAAQKALATGKCQRVESDELNSRSKADSLVFFVSCSSGDSHYFTETELKP